MTDRYTKILLTVIAVAQLSPLVASSPARSHKGQAGLHRWCCTGGRE
jgi:hypothetical protein